MNKIILIGNLTRDPELRSTPSGVLPRGDKIAQVVVLPVLYVDFERADALGEIERGSNGFGSTGR